MLLSDNTRRVIYLLEMFDELKDIDKIRLAIYLLENKNENIDFTKCTFFLEYKNYKR